MAYALIPAWVVLATGIVVVLLAAWAAYEFFKNE